MKAKIMASEPVRAKCPFCGSVCVVKFSLMWRIMCTNKDCSADFCFFGTEFDKDETIARFDRRDGETEAVKAALNKIYGWKGEDYGTVESDQDNL